MTTATQIRPISDSDEETELVPVAPVVEMPSYEYRSQFRPVLITFFEQTDMRNGAYRRAEQQAKEYFQTNFGIDPAAWDYRTRKGGH